MLVPTVPPPSYMTLSKSLVSWTWVFPFLKLEVLSVSFRVPPGFLILFSGLPLYCTVKQPKLIPLETLDQIRLSSERTDKRKIELICSMWINDMNHASLFDYPLDECFLRVPNPVLLSSVLNRSILRETKAFNSSGVGIVLWGAGRSWRCNIYILSQQISCHYPGDS